MPNQSTAANVHHFMRRFPARQPPNGSDPVPGMRREIARLRIEVDHLRALEEEARKTKEFLLAYVGPLMESRDQWQREADRLKALLAQVHEETFKKPRWTLLWWRRRLGPSTYLLR